MIWDAVFGIIGVIIGAAVAMLSPLVTEWVKVRNRRKSLLSALLSELQYNEFATGMSIEPNLTFLSYIDKITVTSCYEQAKQDGVLVSLPSNIQRKIHIAYGRTSQLAYVLSTELKSGMHAEFIVMWEKVPHLFRDAAESLEPLINRKISKNVSQ